MNENYNNINGQVNNQTLNGMPANNLQAFQTSIQQNPVVQVLLDGTQILGLAHFLWDDIYFM